MGFGDTLTAVLREWLDGHPGEPALPLELVNKMMETTERLSRQSAKEQEREELVCRLLAGGMSVPEISLILKIRKEEITMIESDNAAVKIPDYAKKLKARRKARERQ